MIFGADRIGRERRVGPGIEPAGRDHEIRNANREILKSLVDHAAKIIDDTLAKHYQEYLEELSHLNENSTLKKTELETLNAQLKKLKADFDNERLQTENQLKDAVLKLTAQRADLDLLVKKRIEALQAYQAFVHQNSGYLRDLDRTQTRYEKAIGRIMQDLGTKVDHEVALANQVRAYKTPDDETKSIQGELEEYRTTQNDALGEAHGTTLGEQNQYHSWRAQASTRLESLEHAAAAEKEANAQKQKQYQEALFKSLAHERAQRDLDECLRTFGQMSGEVFDSFVRSEARTRDGKPLHWELEIGPNRESGTLWVWTDPKYTPRSNPWTQTSWPGWLKYSVPANAWSEHVAWMNKGDECSRLDAVLSATPVIPARPLPSKTTHCKNNTLQKSERLMESPYDLTTKSRS